MRRLVVAALAVAIVSGSFLTGAPQAKAATSPPGAPTGVRATAGTLSAAVTWVAADPTAGSFTVTSNPGAVTATVPGTATSATVTGLGFGLSYSFTVAGTSASGIGAASAASNFVAPLPPGGPYHAGPASVLLNSDVTSGQPLASNLGDDPAHFPGLSAVVLNVTASLATVPTNVQLVLNNQIVQTVPIAPGQQESSLAVIGVPAQFTQGAVQATTGRAHVEVDFVGYVTAPSTMRDHSGLLKVVPTATLFAGAMATGASTDIATLGHAGVPAAHVAAVLLNVTAAGATAAGALALRPAGSPASNATAVGFGGGQTSANRAIVALSATGAITLADRGAAANAKVEVLGWFSDGTDASALGTVYTPLTPTRLVDTSAAGGPLLAGDTLTFPVWGRGGVPAASATAPATVAILEITAVAPAGAGSVAIAGTSVVDFSTGATVSNVDVVQLASDGSASLGVLGANSNVTVDVVGYLSGDLVVPGTTKRLSPSLLAGITSLTDTTITFAPGVPASPPINLNDVINAGVTPTTPGGFLRRVLGITTSPTGETVVRTRNAALPEALTAYSVNWTLPRSGTSGMRQGVARAATASLPPFQPPPGTSIDPNYPVLTLADDVHHLIYPISASFSSMSGELTVTDLRLQVVPHVEFGDDPLHNPQFAFALSTGMKFQGDVAIRGSIAGKTWTPIDQEIRIPNQLLPPFLIPAGPVVIEFRVLIEFKVTIDLTLQAGISATVKADRYSIISGGYDSTFFGNKQDFDYVPASEKIGSWTPTVQAEVRIGPHFIAGLVFYEFAAVAGDLNPYWRFTVDPFANPWWDKAVGVCGHLIIGIDVQFLFVKILKSEATFDFACQELIVDHAPGPFINITTTPSPVTVARSGTQHFDATESPISTGVSWTLIEPTGGSLSNITVSSVDYTAPSRAGVYHLEARSLLDPLSTRVVEITVTAVAPSLPTNVTSSVPSGTSVTVNWSAPTDDGGAAITDYKVVSSDGTTIDAGTNTYATFTNLTPGTTYTFSVYATNSAVQTSAAALSPSVTVPTQAVVTLTPTSIDFGSNPLATPTQPQTVTVTVSGGSLHVTSVTLGGTRPQDYSIVADQCTGVTIDPRGSCTFQVIFTAAIQNQSTANVLVTDDALDSPQPVAVQGFGPQPVVKGFFSVSFTQFIDSQHGFVGPLRTADSGATWTQQPNPPGFYSSTSVNWLDASQGWFIGHPLATFTPGCINGGNCRVVLHTTDGGATWTRLSVINFLDQTSIVFTDASHGWIVGDGFTGCSPSGTGCIKTQVYATADGGVTWTPQVLADPEACAAPLTLDKRGRLINMLDATTGWVLGVSACLDSANTATNPLTLAWSTTDGGAHWTAHDTGLNAYYFTSYSRLHALSSGQVAFATQDFAGNNAAIFVSTADGGATWTKSAIPDLYSGDFKYLDATNVILIGGANGAQSIWKSTDGGQTWTKVGVLPGQVTSPNPNFTELHFLDIVDSTHWWVTGQIDYLSGAPNSGGLILFSSDRGLTWTIQLMGDGS